MLSHRARLTIALTGVVAALLALVLWGVVRLSESLEIRADRHLLTSALSDLSHHVEERDVSGIKANYAAFPNVTFAVYDLKGNLQSQAGRLPLKSQLEFGLSRVSSYEFVSQGVKTQHYVIVAGTDWRQTAARINRFSLLLAALWVFMVAIVAAVSWLAAAATFRPLSNLTEQAARLSGQNLSSRLEVGDKAEYGTFTVQLNALLDRIEATAKREEQFATDAAHELRTPLAIIRGRIESTLMKHRSSDEYKQSLEMLLPEVDRLTGLVEMLLRSATASNEQPPVIELSAVVQESASRWLDQFEKNGVHLDVEADEVYANIWPEELQCIVDNFLNNALRVSPKNSVCRIVLEKANGHAVIRVADEGTGIPEELIGKVFDRFTRGEESRNRSSGGFGIGLAVCKKIVTTRGGKISVRNKRPGAEFQVELNAVQGNYLTQPSHS